MLYSFDCRMRSKVILYKVTVQEVDQGDPTEDDGGGGDEEAVADSAEGAD